MAALWERLVLSEGANVVGVLPVMTPREYMQETSAAAQWPGGTSSKGVSVRSQSGIWLASSSVWAGAAFVAVTLATRASSSAATVGLRRRPLTPPPPPRRGPNPSITTSSRGQTICCGHET